jgi:hypothetical protein
MPPEPICRCKVHSERMAFAPDCWRALVGDAGDGFNGHRRDAGRYGLHHGGLFRFAEVEETAQ